MNALILLWQREPVIITTLVGAVLSLLVAFGIPISDDQKTAVIALIAAIGALIARSQVTPT